MRTSSRSRLQRFRSFLLAESDQLSLVTFVIDFGGEPLDATEADLIALKLAEWLQGALPLDDGSIMLSAIEDDGGVYGWDVAVIAPDSKAASLLNAYIEGGTIGPLNEWVYRAVSLRSSGVRRFIVR
jgi:hypothetical protein